MGYKQDQYNIHSAAKHKWDNTANKAESRGDYDSEYKYRGKALDARSHADSLYRSMNPESSYDKGHMKAKQVFRDNMKEADKKRNGTTSFY